MNATICEAIAGRSVIEFEYQGGRRVVEPHAHGVSTAGNEVLRGYQTAGYSSSRKPPFWSLYVVSKMRSISVMSSTFNQNRPLYDPNDGAMSRVHCHV